MAMAVVGCLEYMTPSCCSTDCLCREAVSLPPPGDEGEFAWLVLDVGGIPQWPHQSVLEWKSGTKSRSVRSQIGSQIGS